MRLLEIVLLGYLAAVYGHLGHEESAFDLELKRGAHSDIRRSIASCKGHLEKRGHNSRANTRRAALVENYRHAIGHRDTQSGATRSHNLNQSYGLPFEPEAIFEKFAMCILSPESDEGPYWVKGEHIRSNLREDVPGIPIVLEAQFINVETCEPLSEAWWDLWSCNAEAVYSGVLGPQGSDEIDDPANIDTTFLRGVQKTDEDGVVTFKSIFPGHYPKRATHMHMVVLLNATLNLNGTLSGGHHAHIGQFFWNQDLITAVEATWPYNTNRILITPNDQDPLFAMELANDAPDPVLEYIYLGDDLSDGLFAWVIVVVNTSAQYEPSYNFTLTKEGETNETSPDGGWHLPARPPV
ncbi:Putative intradiol ring-cleavage dioxygenase, core [Septoria linicola]|uniref:Intradiol ring-cleavage dioxygenase, core n=1 Tax=Septoria linicola TaxID=215465 RepID=A0A9Q9ARE8_9PEZI|nr:putative intradiol ring-cleavage dioxygenase, core [Septoria linicola]USW53184.1 Putative intradiol ring-cleavage dioxygenase, core [Septoria linicola]